jgi:hypothetical protein
VIDPENKVMWRFCVIKGLVTEATASQIRSLSERPAPRTRANREPSTPKDNGIDQRKEPILMESTDHAITIEKTRLLHPRGTVFWDFRGASRAIGNEGVSLARGNG